MGFTNISLESQCDFSNTCFHIYMNVYAKDGLVTDISPIDIFLFQHFKTLYMRWVSTSMGNVVVWTTRNRFMIKNWLPCKHFKPLMTIELFPGRRSGVIKIKRHRTLTHRPVSSAVTRKGSVKHCPLWEFFFLISTRSNVKINYTQRICYNLT